MNKLLLVFLLIPSLVNSQSISEVENEPLKHELGLEFGVITDFFSFYASEGSSPIGYREYSNRAKLAGLVYGYRFGKHLQFTAALDRLTNKVNEDQLKRNSLLRDPEIDANPVVLTQLLVGIKPSVGTKFRFYIHYQLGLGFLKYGSIRYAYSESTLNSNVLIYNELPEEKMTGFTNEITAGFDISISKQFVLNPSCGFVKSFAVNPAPRNYPYPIDSDKNERNLYTTFGINLRLAYRL